MPGNRPEIGQAPADHRPGAGRSSANDRPGDVDIRGWLCQPDIDPDAVGCHRWPTGLLPAIVGYLSDGQKDSRRRENYNSSVKSSRCLSRRLIFTRRPAGHPKAAGRFRQKTHRELIGMHLWPWHYYRSAGMWWPICSSIQINLTEFHQGKVIFEISLFLHLCVTVRSVPVGCHWLWGIVSLYSDMLCYSSLKWVRFQVSLNPWQTRLILTGWLAQMGTSSDTATQQSAGCCSDSAHAQPWYIFGRVY